MPDENAKTESPRETLIKYIGSSPSPETMLEYIEIISRELRCTPAQAMEHALQAKVHQLTCRNQYPYEPSRH